MKTRARLEQLGKTALSFYIISAIFIYIIIHYKRANTEPLKSNTTRYVEYKGSTSTAMERRN